MVSGDEAVALVTVRKSQQTIPVRIGEIVDGWTIENIEPRQIQIRKARVAATVAVSKGTGRVPVSRFGRQFGSFQAGDAEDNGPEGGPVPDNLNEGGNAREQ